MQDKIILALDTASLSEATEWVRTVRGMAGFFKIGSELFTAAGRDAVEMLKKERAKVFLDLKFHDVPATVSRVCREAVRMGVDLLNVHALGGEPMMRAAVESVAEESERIAVTRPKLIAVTLLTSLNQMDLEHLGVVHPLTQVVERLARLAQRCGLDGVVSSPHEAAMIRRDCGPSFVIVTPGVRMPDSPPDDQKRKATPRQAIEWGADFLVIGRPVWASPDPRASLMRIADSIQARALV